MTPSQVWDPGSPRRGSRFFSGGNAQRTALQQDVALPADGPTGRAAVDAGELRYAVRGWLGGYASQEDGVRLSVEFRDAAGSPPVLSVPGPVTADERRRKTGMAERTDEAAAPAGRAARACFRSSTATAAPPTRATPTGFPSP